MLYGSGRSVSGHVVQDTVTFGSVSVPYVAIGVADQVADGHWPDGVVGLGWGSNCTLNIYVLVRPSTDNRS